MSGPVKFSRLLGAIIVYCFCNSYALGFSANMSSMMCRTSQKTYGNSSTFFKTTFSPDLTDFSAREKFGAATRDETFQLQVSCGQNGKGSLIIFNAPIISRMRPVVAVRFNNAATVKIREFSPIGDMLFIREDEFEKDGFAKILSSFTTARDKIVVELAYRSGRDVLIAARDKRYEEFNLQYHTLPPKPVPCFEAFRWLMNKCYRD